MGLCASMLRWKINRRRQQQPEPRRGTPKALFVVRNDDGRPSKPEAFVFHPPHGTGRLQKAGGRKPEKRGYECYDCMDALGRRLRAPPLPPPPRLPCGSARSVAVEPVVTAGVRPPVSRGATATADGKKAVAVPAAAEGCRTPMTPRRTPLWQRRILMGTRCELPRFSGVILYDEHGRPLQSSSQKNRADQLMSRVSKYDSKGKKRTARTTTTLRDLM